VPCKVPAAVWSKFTIQRASQILLKSAKVASYNGRQLVTGSFNHSVLVQSIRSIVQSFVRILADQITYKTFSSDHLSTVDLSMLSTMGTAAAVHRRSVLANLPSVGAIP